MEKWGSRMVKRFKSYKIALVLVFSFVGLFACKELPPPEVPKQESGRFSHIPKPLSPAPPATSEVPPSTEEASAATVEEQTPATEESSFTTPEEGMPTEVFGETTAEETIGENVVYAKKGAVLFDSKGARRKVVTSLKPGEKLTILSEEEGSEWVEAASGDKKGFVRRSQVCASTLCIEKLRAGVVPVYRESSNVLTPQIQVQVSNLTGAHVRVLRMNAKFYYKGNYIGEDEAYVAAEVIGIKGMDNGDSTSVYFRPYFSLPLDAVISVENPVKVELLCAVEGNKFFPCGELSIDDMLY